MVLEEIRTSNIHYFQDEFGKRQGKCIIYDAAGNVCKEVVYVDGKRREYKDWWWNGELNKHYCCANGTVHGESIVYNSKGGVMHREFYNHSENITAEIELLVRDPGNITEEEQVIIALKYGAGFGLCR